VSIGVSVPLDAQGPATAVELLRDADTAMYGAKSAGRNAVRVADVAMRQSVTRRVELEHDLRIALGEGSLDVHYQPLITLGTGAVRGFETYGAAAAKNIEDTRRLIAKIRGA
jgi:predicted signal transduction protein with EAL and GGDEF domain